MILRAIFTPFIMFTAALLCMGCDMINDELPSYKESSLVTVGDMAPDFTARTLQGEIFTLSEERGNVVFVVLFSHTCPDCKALFNDIVSRIDDIEASGVRMIAVSRGGTQHEIEEYMLSNGYTFDVIADSSAEIYKLYATTYVPRTYLVDRDGVIRHTTIEYNATYVDDIIQQISHL